MRPGETGRCGSNSPRRPPDDVRAHGVGLASGVLRRRTGCVGGAGREPRPLRRPRHRPGRGPLARGRRSSPRTTSAGRGVITPSAGAAARRHRSALAGHGDHGFRGAAAADAAPRCALAGHVGFGTARRRRRAGAVMVGSARQREARCRLAHLPAARHQGAREPRPPALRAARSRTARAGGRGSSRLRDRVAERSSPTARTSSRGGGGAAAKGGLATRSQPPGRSAEADLP